MIKLNKINKVYNKTNHVLKDISISFNKNEFIGIFGPSGCGKTTLMNIIGGIDSYDTGDFYINKELVTKYKEKDWDYFRGNAVGFIFQNYNLLGNLSVYDNVLMGFDLTSSKVNDINGLIDEVLTRLDILKLKNTKVKLLSGGESQRVAIARALVKNPAIILADEPTGALDSKNAEEILKILKDISKDRLVIMVSHNQASIDMYCDRKINLLDGKIISDQVLNSKSDNQKTINIKKTRLSLVSALKIGFKTMLSKPFRTLLTVLSGCVGVLGFSLVLMFSSIVEDYMVDLQKNTLSNSPITIRSQVDNTDPYKENKDYPIYPDDRFINVTNLYTSYYNHINKFDEEFMNYLEDIDKSLYNFMDYKSNVNINLLTIMNGNYKRVQTSRFNEISEDIAYLQTQYDVLEGSLPTSENEIAILVDRYNNIDISVLDSLGIDYLGIDKYSFEDILTKEYRVILNNDIYLKTGDDLYTNFFTSNNYELLYNNSDITLKISGIIRASSKSSTTIYDSGILYSRKLSDFILENSNLSNIVVDQKRLGFSKNVLTGLEFVDEETTFYTRTKEYSYQVLMQNLSSQRQISTIRIYTDDFRSRVLINDYLDNYNLDKESKEKVLYSDYMGNITREFDAFISVLTKVLVVFALISLFVSTILIGIITYVGVVERTREIGILRSLGARRKDISLMFNVETSLVGFTSGIIGVLGGLSLLKPIINLITKVLKDNNVTTFDLTLLDLSKFNPLNLLIIIFGSILLSVIGGFIPAYVASRASIVDAIRD